MGNQNYDKEKLYKRYISTHFSKLHTFSPKEYAVYNRYYSKNYLKFLPEDKNARILDIGCGAGHFLSFLDKSGYKNYLGIDISDENITHCRNRKFNAEKHDAEQYLNSNKTSFNVIVLNDVIEHFDKNSIINLLEEIHDNLADSGVVLIKTANAAHPVLGSSTRYINFTHEIGFTEESLSQVLRVCGFCEVRILPLDIFVFWCNPFNYIAKITYLLLNAIFRLLFLLYGRKSTKIFSKSIIAVAGKT